MKSTAYPNSGAPWTDDEEQQIRRWFRSKSLREIADLLGRTPASVSARAGAMGL